MLVAAAKPSQEPACCAPSFVPATTPKSGTRAGFTAPLVEFEAAATGAAALELLALDVRRSDCVGKARAVAERARRRIDVKECIVVSVCKIVEI